MNIDVIIDNMPYFWRGIQYTLVLSIIGMAGALVCGVLLCMARISTSLVLRVPAQLYIDIIRSAPLLLFIFWFVFFVPKITNVTPEPVVSGMIAIIAYFATHVAEIMRAGINTIPKGQSEAAYSTGLDQRQTMQFVVLPQALRNMIPALISRFVALLKSTSLLYIIGVIELFRAATIVNNREFASYEIFTFVGLVYFVLCYSLSRFGEWCQRRLRARGMRDLEASLGW